MERWESERELESIGGTDGEIGDGAKGARVAKIASTSFGG